MRPAGRECFHYDAAAAGTISRPTDRPTLPSLWKWSRINSSRRRRRRPPRQQQPSTLHSPTPLHSVRPAAAAASLFRSAASSTDWENKGQRAQLAGYRTRGYRVGSKGIFIPRRWYSFARTHKITPSLAMTLPNSPSSSLKAASRSRPSGLFGLSPRQAGEGKRTLRRRWLHISLFLGSSPAVSV